MSHTVLPARSSAWYNCSQHACPAWGYVIIYRAAFMTSCLFPNIYVLGVSAKSRKVSISFVKHASLLARPSSWNNSAPAGETCIKFYVGWTITIVCGKYASLVKITIKQYALYMKTKDIYDYFSYWLTTATVDSNNNECNWYYTFYSFMSFTLSINKENKSVQLQHSIFIVL